MGNNRTSELVIAKKELAFQMKKMEKCEAQLIIANKKIIFQKAKKEKLSACTIEGRMCALR